MSEEPAPSIPIHWRGFPRPVTTYDFVRSITARSSSPREGERAHSTVVKLGLLSNTFISSALIDRYCKSKRMPDARRLFDEMTRWNVVSWNVLIRGYSQAGTPGFSVRLFSDMLARGISPSPFTVSSVLLACSAMASRAIGTLVHCAGLKHGFCSNVVVGTALVDMYSKCSPDMGDSRKVFDDLRERNVVTWTSLVTGYAAHQRPDDAMMMVNKMRASGVELNEVTHSSLLSSFTRGENLICGKQIHCLLIQQGLESDLYVSVALSSMYSRCGSAMEFVNTLHSVSTQDPVMHNSVVAGFSHLGNLEEVMVQITRMRHAGIDIDYFTFGSLLGVIGISSALGEGKQTHALVLKCGYASNLSVQNVLVAMYARCGAIGDSKLVFSSIDDPDLVSWNTVIAGCAQHGHGNEAVQLFEEMRNRGVKPNNTTFLSVLSACSHVGLLEKGIEHFNLLTREDESAATPRVEHYSSVVDLLGRAGHLDEAESLLKSMPVKPGPSIYKSLLSACHVHGNMEMAARTAGRLLELCPGDSAAYVLLSKVFADMSHWDDSATVRKDMVRKGVKKQPGWSCTERC